MDNLDLESGESIRKRIPDIIADGVWYEIVLTDRHLILVDRETVRVREKIAYPDIVQAVSGINALQEPILTVSVRSQEGGPRSVLLVFVYQPAGKNIENLDACLSVLGGYGVPVQGTAHREAAIRRIRNASGGLVAMDEEEDEAKIRRQQQGVSLPMARTSRSGRKLPPAGSEDKKILMTIGIIMFVLIAFVGGSFFIGQMLKAKNAPSGTAVATPAVTPAATPAPTATPVPSPTEVPPLASGIWARVSSPGEYAGVIAAGGWQVDVNSSGTQLYHITVQDTVINVLIEKKDGSANPLEVEIYNGGSVVSVANTTKPRGSVEMHVPVGPAIVNTPVPTLTVAAVTTIPTPDTSLSLLKVPETGTWVRVTYPGNFTGYVDANGYRREISSSGDQFYQLSLNHGAVDAILEKADGSAGTLLLQLYRDGKIVTQASTTRPLGQAEIHTTI